MGGQDACPAGRVGADQRGAGNPESFLFQKLARMRSGWEEEPLPISMSKSFHVSSTEVLHSSKALKQLSFSFLLHPALPSDLKLHGLLSCR